MGDGIYKVWIRGEGEEVLLGTLVPERGRLLLCRTISLAELQKRACWPVRGARCAMTYSFSRDNRGSDGWGWTQSPQNLTDAETKSLGQWRPMLSRRGEGFAELAVPLRKNDPLPLSHLFCLAEPRCIRGELHLVWRFDENGHPIPYRTASE